MTNYRLLNAFRGIFEGVRYIHRRSNLGDMIAMQLYEDLASVSRSARYAVAISTASRVLNAQNKRKGVEARRGDGTFGELIIGETPVIDLGYQVARGPIATVEIGVEVKILAKAMIKQIDRVQNDLANQVTQFRSKAGSSNPICVGIVGINYAEVATGYEADRIYRTDGKKNKHPIQEAEAARNRLKKVSSLYDEFLVMKYRATNESPFPFEWVNEKETAQEYGAALIRISNEYERRF